MPHKRRRSPYVPIEKTWTMTRSHNPGPLKLWATTNLSSVVYKLFIYSPSLQWQQANTRPLPLHPFVLADCCLFGLCSLEDTVHASIDLFSQQLLINYVIPSPDWPFLYPRSACCSGHGEYVTVLTKVSHRASLRFSCWWLSGEGDKVTHLDSPGSRRAPGQVVQGGSSSFFWLSLSPRSFV